MNDDGRERERERQRHNAVHWSVLLLLIVERFVDGGSVQLFLLDAAAIAVMAAAAATMPVQVIVMTM